MSNYAKTKDKDEVPYPMYWYKENAITPKESGIAATYMALCMFSDRYGICWPGQKTLARNTGRKERTIMRHLQHLENNGYITKKKRYRKDGSQTSCLYMITAYRLYCKAFLLNRGKTKEAKRYKTADDDFLDTAMSPGTVIKDAPPCHNVVAEVPSEVTTKSSSLKPKLSSSNMSPPEEEPKKESKNAPPQTSLPSQGSSDERTGSSSHANTGAIVTKPAPRSDASTNTASNIDDLKRLTGESNAYVSHHALYYELKDLHPKTFTALELLKNHLSQRGNELTKAEYKNWMITLLKDLKTHRDETVTDWLTRCTSSTIKHPMLYYRQCADNAPKNSPGSNGTNSHAQNLLRNRRFTPGKAVRLRDDGSVWSVDIALSNGLIRIENEDDTFIDVIPDRLEIIQAA